tara:strand:- start:2371 stop:3309 length:939 start_codon:yes stop_codon:yes gene_type:complete
MDYSNIYIGQVTSKGTLDPTHSGDLEVKLLNSNQVSEPIIAKCAMPFGGKGSGLIGPVTPLSRVLVARVNTSSDDKVDVFSWYWIGVIPTYSNVRKESEDIDLTDFEDTGTIVRSTLPESEKAYYGSDVNQKVLLKSTVGHKLELSEKVLNLEGNINHQEDYALLTTNSNKHIKLDAGVGPGMDRIIISDENDNRIVIKAGDDGDTPGPNSMVIECQGNMHLNSKSGEMVLNVEKDSTSKIQIINDGAGDINVEARQGDVNVGAAKGDINLSAKGTVQIDAEQDINLDASNDISINAGNQMTLTASRIDLNP